MKRKRCWFLGGLLGVLVYAVWYAFFIVKTQSYPADFEVFLMSPGLFVIKLLKSSAIEINGYVTLSLLISAFGFFAVGSVVGMIYGKNKYK